MAFLEINDVEKTFFSFESMTTAIEQINVSIQKGEFISIIGPSGCGKTTLLSMISGLTLPTKGQITLNGAPIKKPTPDTGYMLQQDYLFPWLSIEENILLGLKTLGNITQEKKKRPLQLLEQMDLLDKRNNYPYELSGGMRQRVALVRMLSTNPELLLLDEPFSALDYRTKLKLEDLVFSTIRAHKKTAILVTHDIGEAIAMSDRIILLTGVPGRIKKEFAIPIELSQELPFNVRTCEKFNALFQEIWKEMESGDRLSS